MLFLIACPRSQVFAEEPRSSQILKKITFGSCASQDKPQPIWETLIKQNPDLFLFIGDNIYADTEDMAVMQEKYKKLLAKPGYQRLLRTTPVLSIWDDHDYGSDDAGAEYPKKKEAEKIFLDFFQVDKHSPRRKRPGIYGAKIFGKSGKQVQIILLDTRYFRDPQVRNRESSADKKKKNIVGKYLPTQDTSTTILGKAQWEWLEVQLKKDADVRIIASSIQVVSYEKGLESWGNFPHERRRLFDLIAKTGASGAIFISGDVHFSEISKTDEGPYPLIDFTSSGITNSYKRASRAVNSYRVGKAYAKPNFGLTQIDWNGGETAITLQTISVEGQVVIEHRINLSELQTRE